MERTFSAPTVLHLESRLTPAANLQFFHQSPFAAVASVDVYVNNVKTLDDVPFRQSTAFLSVPDSAALKIDVVAAVAVNNSAPLATTTLTLAANGNAIVAFVGDPSATAPADRLTLSTTTAAQNAAADPTLAAVTLIQASPDVGTVDVKIRRFDTLADDSPRYAFSGFYENLTPAKYVLDVTAADGITPVGSYNLDLSGAAGTARTLVLSGFSQQMFPTDPTLSVMTVDSKGFGTFLTRARPFGQTSYAVGGDGTATLYSFDGTEQFTASLPRIPLADGTSVARLNSVRVAAADVNNDQVADLIVVAGPTTSDPQTSLADSDQVFVFDGATGAFLTSLTPFESSFTGGLFVAAGDLNNDGYADIILSPDQGGGPRVQVLSGKTFTHMVPDFFGIADSAFRGGARPSLGDINGDGTPDLIVAAGFGGGPRVAIFNGLSLIPGGSPGRMVPDFFAFESTLRNGAYVAGGDVNGDGFAEVIAGGGPGGGPRVVAFSGASLVAPTGSLVPVANFFAGDSANRDGVRVAAKDLDGDYRIDLVVGLGPDGTDRAVKTFAGKSLPLTGNAAARSEFDLSTTGGVFVG